MLFNQCMRQLVAIDSSVSDEVFYLQREQAKKFTIIKTSQLDFETEFAILNFSFFKCN